MPAYCTQRGTGSCTVIHQVCCALEFHAIPVVSQLMYWRGNTVYYNTEGNTVTNVDENDVFTFSAEPK